MRASAESLMAYVATRSRDPRLRETAQRGVHARESDPAQDHNSAVALYNQGVSYANQGQYTQALAWFKRAGAATRDSGLKADAERRSGEVRGTLLVQEGVMLFNSGKLGQARKQFLNALTFPLTVDDKRYVRRFIRQIDAQGGQK